METDASAMRIRRMDVYDTIADGDREDRDSEDGDREGGSEQERGHSDERRQQRVR